MSIFLLANSCKQSGVDLSGDGAVAATPTPGTPTSSVAFAGLSSISNITGSSMQLNWANVSGAASYTIFNTTTGSMVYVAAVAAPAPSYVVTGLTINTPYTFRVRLTDSLGLTDTNTSDVTATTLSTLPPSSLTYTLNSATYTVGTAISTNSPNSSGGAVASYSISPALPTGLSFNTSNGQITGTPTVIAAAANYTVTATNAGGSATATLTFTINFAGLSSITGATGASAQLNWTNIADAASYTVYNVTSGSMVFVSTVNAPATSYTASGLGAGTTYKFRVRATDSLGLTDTNTNDVSTTTLTPIPPSSLTYTLNTANYTVGTAIATNSPNSSGGAVASYSISPALPTGLSFNTGNGQITGTPSVISAATAYTVTATNAGGSTTATLTFTVNFAGLSSITGATGSTVQLNWTNIADAASYAVYNVTGAPVFISTVNAPATTYTVTGLAAGTTYKFRVRATDGSGLSDSNTNDLSITTVSTGPPTSLTYTLNTASYTVGTAISTNSPNSSGGAVASYSISPALPTGLSFNTGNGQITGTPTVISAATSYTVTATNAGGSTTATLNFTVNFAGLSSITGATGSTVQLNWTNIADAASYSVYNVTSGAVFVATFAAPASSYTVTGLTAGTTYKFRVRATDGSSLSDSNASDISITTVSTAPPSSLTYTLNTTTYTVGTAISTNSPNSSGGAVASYAISPALPTGLTFNTSNGQITGTPTIISAAANYTVTATNAGGSTTATLNFTVNFAGLSSITGATGSTVQLNWTNIADAASYAVYDVTGSPVFVSTVNAPASSYTVTGLAAGTTYKFRVRATDGSGLSDSNASDISITTISTVPPSNLTYSTNPANYTLGTAITTNSPSTNGGAPTSYAISPALPTGLSFSTVNGQITGTPTALSNSATYTITATNAGGSTTATVPIAVNFAGISSIDNVAALSVRLNWTSAASAAQYQVYNVTSGSQVYVASVSAPASSYTVSGLTSATAYQFRVRMIDTSGVQDANTNNVSVTTATIIGTFNGWTTIKAIGAKTPAAQGSDLATSVAAVTLSWPAVTVSAGSVASYNIYRTTTSGGETYSTPFATGISTGTLSYTDSTVTGGTTYYYTIAPVVGSTTVIPTTVADSEVKVIVPTPNMILLHRWAANNEMCGQMAKAVDRTQNYRCTVLTGANAPPGTGGSGYLDLGASLFVDTYGQGCNYTYSASANKCGSANGCIGILSTPNAVVTGNLNDVYYSRLNGTCYINTNGATAWAAANSASTAQLQIMGSAAPGLPPFVNINQTNSQLVCTGQTVTGFAGAKRLLKRREQVLAAAWDSSLSDATINTIENGTNLDTTHYCNSNYASPQGNTTTDISGTNPTISYDNLSLPAAKDTLPSCRFGDCASTAATIRSVRTGSNATSACVSRYGAQDMAGNVWQWSSDQINCNGTTCAGQTGGSNTVDTSNIDWAGLAFDDTQGPTKDPTHTTLNTVGTGYTFTSWGYMQLPIGIPIAKQSLFTGDGVVSRTSAQFHGDIFYINVSSSARGAIAGGSWGNGAASGRFALDLVTAPSSPGNSVGLRCALPAE